MNKTFFYIALIAMLALSSTQSFSQTKKRTTTATRTTKTVATPKWTPIKTELFEYEDSSKVGDVHIKIELPIGDNEESLRLRNNIYNLLSNNLGIDSSYGGDNDKIPAYTGEENVDKMCKYFSDGIFRAWDKEIIDEEIDINDEYFNGFERNITFSKIEESNKYVVFSEEIYGYENGAHGGSYGRGAITYDKKTGKILEDILKPNTERSMQALLRRGLKSYFSANEGVRTMTDSQLYDILMIEGHTIPLPAVYNVYPSKKGLVFVYGEYEIASYADGMPSFVIPYAQVKPYLTTAAKQLFGLQ